MAEFYQENTEFNFKKIGPIAALVLALVLFLGLGNRLFLTIDATERGVMFKPFGDGLARDEVYSPGFHIIAPWNKMYIFNVQEQKSEEPMDVLDKNGLSVNIDITVRFYPTYTRIGYLYEGFMKDYASLLVIPEVRSTVRQVAGRYTAEEIYSTKRSEVEQAIIDEAGAKLKENNIEMKALLIRSINLPNEIKKAIETKLTKEQEQLAYEFRLKTEKLEAERKRVMAEGEAAANKIVNSSLTPELLKMRGIEATLDLAKSPNSKVVIVGSGKDGLPLILGGNN
ncbi:prohibitin family protein [bacterium]|jgi:regulator of protease activity HflC (stomatin/prohibitin superfamily)|nr:peptidase [Crocinitomicaceae bacterium]MCH9823406.1 prohibitin family protein [Bacteroidota bacterium]MDA9967710.1 prohibitin family protein [Salibacteraceae bacterium]MDB9983999.1 prohibitin family protein [bacterium]|tara:strand:+ start:107292 stop:108140 length:849 start_codon:yes stop_codon:yes gene_type:complete